MGHAVSIRVRFRLPIGGSLRHVVTALLSSALDCGKNAAGVASVCVCASMHAYMRLRICVRICGVRGGGRRTIGVSSKQSNEPVTQSSVKF